MQVREEHGLSARNGTNPLPFYPNAESHLTNNLASGGVLICNEVSNSRGQSIPLFIVIKVLPMLVTMRGIERFGVLMLMWMCINCFLLLDRK